MCGWMRLSVMWRAFDIFVIGMRRWGLMIFGFVRRRGRRGCDTEVYHFIGKDILYFHGLFWPTMLKNSGYRRPTRLFVHGFLTVNGEKMSKSRGTFITAEKYGRTGMSPDLLRYYYSCKLGDGVDDIDLKSFGFPTAD